MVVLWRRCRNIWKGRKLSSEGSGKAAQKVPFLLPEHGQGSAGRGRKEEEHPGTHLSFPSSLGLRECHWTVLLGVLGQFLLPFSRVNLPNSPLLHPSKKVLPLHTQQGSLLPCCTQHRRPTGTSPLNSPDVRHSACPLPLPASSILNPWQAM